MKIAPLTLFTAIFGTCCAVSTVSFAQADLDREDGDATTSPVSLEVHEWGTFTVLQGSDGQVIQWYQAPPQLIDLPPFVARSMRISGKSGTGFGQKDTVRMETPVLYFYPEKEMDITVSASFPNGRITELFPPAAQAAVNGETVWHGTLLPPNSPERKNVPAAAGVAGRHYAAAREVPDAWLFRNKPLPMAANQTTDATQPHRSPLPLPNADQKTTAASFISPAPAATKRYTVADEPIEHFIFYRGAGQHPMYELQAVQGNGPDDFTLSNHGRTVIPKIFAIRIAAGLTSWRQLDTLAVTQFPEGKTLNQRGVSFTGSSGPTDAAAIDLRRAMIASLHAEGLTSAEAIAMVNTWDNLWFTEPGTRFLAILPQQFADEMVPLKVTPTPNKIDRVFVARVEIITREKEQVLTSLLNTSDADANLQPATAQFADLQLGRYAAGGMERALTLLDRKMRNRFALLNHAAKEAEELQAKTD